MPSISLERSTTKSKDALWEVIADFPNIAKWNSGVKTSVSTSDAERGVGATRHCQLSPAGALDERILAWEEGQRVKISVDQAKTAPIKTATADFTLTETPHGVLLAVDYEFTPKGGALGKAASPGLKLAFTKAFNGFLEDWDNAA
jgi:hypothetical protein